MVVLVLTGPPGVGKTSVLTALVDALGDDDVRHAAVEAEALRWTHPALSAEQEMRHLQAIGDLYRQAGHGLLLIAQTVESDADLAALLVAARAEQWFVVRLEAQPATLVSRIIAREPASWSGLAGLVEHAQQLAESMPALSRVDLVLSTERQTPESVADRIREALPDVLGVPRPRRS